MRTYNKLLLAVVIAVGFLGVLRTTNATQTLILDYGTRHYSNGGEFNISQSGMLLGNYASVALANVHGPGFETFCLEYGEHFNPGQTYDYAISQAAIRGGTNTSDPISNGTAFLYHAFATNTFASYGLTYDYTTLGGGNTAAGALQTAIWWLEDETGPYNSANPYENYVVNNIANYHDNSNGAYGVWAVNITYHGDLAQDQLVMLPVPDGGATGMLLGVGLLGLFLFNRKVSRRQAAAA